MTSDGHTAYLLLGSNVGNRMSYLDAAVLALPSEIEIIGKSPVYETDAWGDRSQDAYLNQVICVRTRKDPVKLHQITRRVESAMGRREKGNYRPRTIDIDILFFDNQVMKTEKLTIPHPRIHLRRFVLIPMCDIAPDLVHPDLKKTMAELLDECPDELGVRRYQSK